ncbi:MAG: leucine--tRNA ligase, partial [Candidatus Paceibacteria bacterium]
MKYNPGKIERKWQQYWFKKGVFEPDLVRARRPFYNLMMFPYPSAEGLHVGNMYAFTGADIYGRYRRMQSNDVFEPIGLDGFGIHSENYALSIGVHPKILAKRTQKNFYRQLHATGNSYAWKNKLETYDPEYYRWTQWIFVQMFKNGLAYRKKASVNWCPSCLTVLADEQVIGGECERCGTKVTRKELEQWFFRITAYADRLLKNLEKIDWSENVKLMQKNWIGRSEGYEVEFKVAGQNERIRVFTTRIDTLFGATYLVLAPEHPSVPKITTKVEEARVKNYVEESLKKSDFERTLEKEKTGVFSGSWAINPATKEKIPIWISDYVLLSYGTGAIMGVPSHDRRDWEFAKKFHLPIRQVITWPDARPDEPYEGEGTLINSGPFDRLASAVAREKIANFVGARFKIQYKLRDWLISRQRYWGPPIPVVFCQACKKRIEDLKRILQSTKLKKEFSKGEIENPGWIAVPERNLPVLLPYIKNFRPTGTGVGPLASLESFVNTRCPKCKGPARRETDVSDTFLDSAWYFLRYPSVKYKKGPWEPKVTKKWLPVDMYIGGAEHAVLHLLYSRFLTMVF